MRRDGGERWLTRLPADLNAAYSSAVDGLAALIDRSLGEGVVANRWSPCTADGLEPWAVARGRLGRRMRAIDPALRGSTIVRSDVLACYASIGRAAVAASLPAGDPHAALLGRTLARIHARGGAGLPVGPPPSGVIANAVLAAADRAVEATGARYVRWVDDVLMFADGPRQARRAFDAWRVALGRAGLEVNEAKTAIGVDPEELPGWAGSAWHASRRVR
ncbi:MAG: RNA-directed DNA polymerase [Actinomycetota bacterium]